MKIKEIILRLKLNVQRFGRKISEFLGLRQTRYGANTVLAVATVLGILILVNFIFYKENIRFDLTKNKKFTLSDQTKKILSQVNQELKILGFFTEDTQREAENLLKEYQTQNKKIKVQFVDPDKKPLLAKQYGVTRYGTLILEMEGRRQEVTEISEREITSAILRLVKNEKKVVYFLTGHGEKDIEPGNERSYSQVKNQLEKENYEVKKLNLITNPKIPSDAAVIIIASPRKRLFDKEKEVISQYLDKGGKLFLLLDPKFEVKEDIGLADLLAKWGIEIDTNLIIDPAKYFFQDPGTVVIDKWSFHKITENLPATFFPGVAKVAPKKDLPKNVSVQSLAQTTSHSWLETNFNSQTIKFDAGQDQKGPISLAVVAEKETNEKNKKTKEAKTRLAVFGDSDFAVDAFSTTLFNHDLFINTVEWLTESEEMISIRPKPQEERRVNLSARQTMIVLYSTIFGMPLVVVAGGIAVWLWRKKKK